jgi:hypothetical protein
MKRDWDTIREILAKLEGSESNRAFQLSSFPPDRAAEISYNMELLIEAGLVEGSMSKAIGPGTHNFLARRLTWSGHEFLDSIRSDAVWKKTKSSFISNGISMTFDLVKSVASEVAAAMIKTSMGI